MKLPTTGFTEDGNLVTLDHGTSDDFILVAYKGADDKSARALTARITHPPHAVERFESLTGLKLDYTPPPKAYAAKPAPHECDWEWTHPDDPENRDIHCTICGAKDVAEDDS